MKSHFLKPFVGAVVIFSLICGLSGCDLLDDATDVTIPTHLEATYNLNLPGAGENVNFTLEKTIDIEDNPDIAKYSNKIKEFYVESISYKVIESSDETVKFTNAELSTMGNNGNGISCSLPDEMLLKVSNTETAIIDISEVELVSLSQHLKNEKSLVSKVTGTLSKTPITAKIVFKYKVKVVANPID